VSDPTIPDWINAGAAAVGAFVLLFGLLGANFKFNESQRTARQTRRSHVAEELIALSFNVDDALKEIRNPLSSIPKDKVDDKTYTYEKRYSVIVKYNDLFKRLRNAQIRVRAVIGDAAVDAAVEKLFKARNEVVIAIEILADYEREDSLNSEDKSHRIELRRKMYGSYSERDEFGKTITSAVSLIEKNLSPIARLEQK